MFLTERLRSLKDVHDALEEFSSLATARDDRNVRQDQDWEHQCLRLKCDERAAFGMVPLADTAGKGLRPWTLVNRYFLLFTDEAKTDSMRADDAFDIATRNLRVEQQEAT